MRCVRCDVEFSNNKVPNKFLLIEPDRYLNCKDCRKYSNCKNCDVEFKHHQNQTCSIKCSKEMKEKSCIKSCGTKHNFSKNSKSRLKWENDIFLREGITNVFQRESVKEKSKLTIFDKFGVDNISKIESVKEKKRLTFLETFKSNPNMFKDYWHKTHKKYIEKIGYDPRLHLFGKASKESLIIFEPLILWCMNNKISYDDIYIGLEEKKEYFISDGSNIFFYDFTIRGKKIIIEFNGVLFHAKEDSKNWRNPFTNESASDNIKKAKIKQDIAIKNGFKIIEIWSDEDPIVNLELCKKFIIENL